MTNCVDHPNPCIPPAGDTVRVTVDLEKFGMPGRFEKLTVMALPDGNFVVACLPFFSYGIQFGDLVVAAGPERMFERVLKQSGLRTLRPAFKSRAVTDDQHEKIHERLLGSGLPHEWHGSGYVSILLRSLADQKFN